MLKTLLCVSFACLVNGAANAIDFSVVLKNDDGDALQSCTKFEQQGRECQKFVDLTLGIAAATALNASEQGMSLEDSYKRGALAAKVRGAKELELNAEDVALIKKQLPKVFNPSVVFKAVNLLDPPK